MTQEFRNKRRSQKSLCICQALWHQVPGNLMHSCQNRLPKLEGMDFPWCQISIRMNRLSVSSVDQSRQSLWLLTLTYASDWNPGQSQVYRTTFRTVNSYKSYIKIGQVDPEFYSGHDRHTHRHRHPVILGRPWASSGRQLSWTGESKSWIKDTDCGNQNPPCNIQLQTKSRTFCPIKNLSCTLLGNRYPLQLANNIHHGVQRDHGGQKNGTYMYASW